MGQVRMAGGAPKKSTGRALAPARAGDLRQAGRQRPEVSDHALRHTAATLAYQYTRARRAVQHMLGHADPRTTARYAHLVERLQPLSGIVPGVTTPSRRIPS